MILFILGLCVGSFVNMAVYRIYRNVNLWDKKRSFCDYCGKQIKWYENIPVISWLMLKGRTRCCGKKLDIIYPFVEMITGILFVLIGQNWLGLIVGALLIFLVVFDAKYMLLPEKALYLLIILGLIGGFQNWMVGLVFGLFFWMLSKIKIRGQEAMGDGDPYLALFIGLWLGWILGMVAIYIAFISGAVFGVIKLWQRKMGKSDPLPFGPFLIGGTVISWLNSEIILYYLNRWF